MKRISFILAAVLLVAGASSLVWWSSRQPAAPAAGSIPLPDGSWVKLEAATYGTNHLVGPKLALLANKMPLPVQRLMHRVFGKHSAIRFMHKSDSPKLVLWLNRGTMASRFSAASGYMECVLSDTNGFASGENVHYNASYSLEAKEFVLFPRREREFLLTIYHHDPQGKVHYCGEMLVPNPVYQRYPRWTPEPLPATKRAGDVEVTLHRLITGVSDDVRHGQLPDGRKTIELAPRREGEESHSLCFMSLRPLTSTNEIWRIAEVTVSDATGNRAKCSRLAWGSHGENYLTFAPGLWTNEAAWKLICEIRRVEGFRPDEQFTFRNVPLAAPHPTNRIGWTTNIMGVTVTLEHVLRPTGSSSSTLPYLRRQLTGFQSWASSNVFQVEFTIAGLTNGLNLDLIAARTSAGENLVRGSWSSGADRQSYAFRRFPLEADTADFTFAVQTNQNVEFLVKPETGVKQVELPVEGY